MILIVIRTVIIFITLLIIMRLMGKRQIGEMQPFELVITLVIAELACIPMADTSIPLLYGITAIVTIYLLHQIVCLLDLYSNPMKSLVSGKPSVVINQSGIDLTQLKKNNLDVSDLIEAMRNAGYFSLDAIEYAVYESSGTFSAMAKNNAPTNTSLPLLIINDGKYEEKNLQLIHLSKNFFDNLLKANAVKSAKKVIVLTLDGSGKVYLQERKKKYKVFTCELPKGIQW